ncbi:nucleoporin protein Ndc1-Nup, partial [Vararia minispora EC-137]
PITPIRAITSNLHARSPPFVPKAAQTYEPLVRNVLRQRLLREIFPYSALCVWFFESFWIHLNLSKTHKLGVLRTLAVPLKPGTLAASFLTWAFVVLPILLARRDNLVATRTAAASPAQLFKAAFSRRATRSIFLLYIITSLSFFLTQLSVARLCRSVEELHLNVFVKSKRHPFYLNGRFVYTILSQIFIGAVFFARNVMFDRFAVRWKETFSERNGEKIAQRLIVVSIASLLLSISGLVGYTILFAFVRSLVLPVLLSVPVLHMAFRPFCAHFIRGRWTVLLPLSIKNIVHIWRTYLLNLFLVASLEFAETLFDENVRKPLAVAPHSAEPGTTLVSGATSASIYYKFFAYRELRDFASDGAERSSTARTALFGDQKHSPTLWATLVLDSLLLLGNDYQLLLRRGKPPPPPFLAAAPASPPEKRKVPELPSTPLERKKIFKTSAPSPVNAALEALAADGAISQAVETSAERLPSVFQAAHVPLPHIPLPTLPAASAIVPVRPPSSGIGTVVGRWTPGAVRDVGMRLGEWWASERLSKVAESSLPNRDLDALVIESLSYLVCASLTEDRYGVVQRDIPRILEAFVSLLIAVEEYHTELLAAVPPHSDTSELNARERRLRARKAEEIDKARDVLLVVDDALKNSIMRIVQTFGSKMTAFKFPPRTAEKLQEFVNY